ncbi:MAG TPA: transcriptional repressor [Candidatus Ventricola intestinavium]|nr:transcriptional repressor [Candidatus Ventricola intestinavium]
MKTRISPQAQMVLGVLSQRCCHLTAEEILGSLEGIGAATVYRALERLTELGLVHRLALGRKSAVYELVRGNHMHFVCRRCGGVFDIPADLSGMVTEAAKCCGHQVQEADVTAFGVCKDCRSAGTQPDSPAGM